MALVQKSIRLPGTVIKQIEDIACNEKSDFTTVVTDLLSEAIRVYRCPGIVFSEGVNGRRARLAGTGLEVWEVIASYKSTGEDFKRLSAAFHWLSAGQLKSALAYYRMFNDEIDDLIAANDAWSPESLKNRAPFLSPENS
jgi:uncharacterized protein (DUF433 family)